ncbi:SDR family oxidoreductase [Roseburia hominis]
MKNLNRFGELFDLSGHVAVVTGAAQGNGLGIANALFDAGATVIATDIRFGEESKEERLRLRDGIEKMIMDVTKEEEVEEVFAKIAERFGKLDILCNNAGIIYKNPVDKLELDRFKNVIDINLHGTVICTKHAVPYMKKAGWGRIVNISSSQAFLTSETYSAYSASKSAVSHLTRIWGNELAADNILVNALCPCYVMTPMMVNSIARKAEELGTDTDGGYKYFADMLPTHRLLEIEEVGNWAAVLCSELSMATTGSNISITCGQVQL